MTPRLVIVDGVRTPFSKAGTDLAHLDAVELGRIAVTALLKNTGLDPALVDEVIFGCVSQPADAANVAQSSPLYTSKSGGASAINRDTPWKSPVESFTATMFGFSESCSRVACSIRVAVRPGML